MVISHRVLQFSEMYKKNFLVNSENVRSYMAIVAFITFSHFQNFMLIQ